MNDLIPTSSNLLPLPALPTIAIRSATMADLPFIDALQKKNHKQVGFFPTKAIEGKIALGQVIVAWAPRQCSADTGEAPVPRGEERVGYLIGQDQYFKRDDVGVIYQINVIPEMRRSLVAATLLKAQFERSAWGCKLYCCWCAQDIEANRFWEAMGLVPLAFRAGSEKKRRVHIFWSKRIRQGDTSTPWWFPSETKGGSMMEDRLVFPVPPGTRWSDAMPMVLPGAGMKTGGDTDKNVCATEDTGKNVRATRNAKAASPEDKRPTLGGLRFERPEPVVAKPERPKPQRKTKVRNDPKFVSAVRELRDRWLEQVNAGQHLPQVGGKYEVCRALGGPVDAHPDAAALTRRPTPLLNAA